MAYPPPPGKRIAYDLDGSVGLIQNKSTREWFDIHPAALTALNDERSGGVYVNEVWGFTPTTELAEMVIVFPIPMRIRGAMAFCAVDTAGAGSYMAESAEVYTSTDSTNGSDGTFIQVLTLDMLYSSQISSPEATDWENRSNDAVAVSALTGTNLGTGAPLNDEYRRAHLSAVLPGFRAVTGPSTRQVRAVKVRQMGITGSSSTFAPPLHLFLWGEPDTAAMQDRLEFWSALTDTAMGQAVLDWGDVPVGTSEDREFRIKNLSAEKTAMAISLAISYETTAVPNPKNFLLFSQDDGVTWTPSATVGSLSPGAISAPILIRRTVPTNAVLSNWSPRILTEVGSWA